MNIKKLFALVKVDQDGRVVSIQRRSVMAPTFRPQSGDALSWLHAYWRMIAVLSLRLLRMNYRADELVLEVRWFHIALLRFGLPWTLESEEALCWALALRGGLLGASEDGYFACGARRDGKHWQLTMTLRGFAPRIATFYPHAFWKRFYSLTQGTLHHMLGIVYLAQRGRSMASRSAKRGSSFTDCVSDEGVHSRCATNWRARP